MEKTEEKNFEFSVQELYNLRERNYDWQSFKYQLPRKYNQNATCNVRPGAMFFTKTNFLDILQKEKKKIPGPSQYRFSTTCLRPNSGKMDKSKRMTVSDQVQSQSEKQNIPGPGSYFKRPQSALTDYSGIREKPTIERTHYLNQVQYLGANSPGVGQYNLTYPKHIPGLKICRQTKTKKGQNEKKRQGGKSKQVNVTSQTKGTFEWMKNQPKSKDSKFFGRSKRFMTETKVDKKPNPTSYTLNNDWTSKTNIKRITSIQSNYKNLYYR